MRAASLLDLAGTKLKALLQRVEAKDYRDIAALLEHGIKLEDILGSARALFGVAFNPLIAQISTRSRPTCETACSQLQGTT